MWENIVAGSKVIGSRPIHSVSSMPCACKGNTPGFDPGAGGSSPSRAVLAG